MKKFLTVMFVCLLFCSFSYADSIFDYDSRYRNDMQTLQDDLYDMKNSLRRQETRQLNDRWERRQQMREQQGLPREPNKGQIGNALEEKRRELFDFYKR
jgi:hypothetical protein